MTKQTNQPKPSVFRRALCACGLHSWEDMEPDAQCSQDFFAVYELEFYWRKCLHCGLEEDMRCDICKEHGTKECNRIYDAATTARRRREKTVHCCGSCKCPDSAF